MQGSRSLSRSVLVPSIGSEELRVSFLSLVEVAGSVPGVLSRRVALVAEFGEGADVACLYDPELHDGPSGSESPVDRAAREDVAREVCQGCPLREGCLAYALCALPARGIWAGFTAAEVATLDRTARTAEAA
jgi:hypothetical protein